MEKKIAVKVTLGLDLSAYMETTVEVPEALVQPGAEERLRELLVAQMEGSYDDGGFTEFEPDWESQSAFRLVCVEKEREEEPGERKVLLEDITINPNYQDFGLEVMTWLGRKMSTGILHESEKEVLELARLFNVVRE